MALFTGYFDDSGAAEHPLAVVCGGFVASTEQAIELERNWKNTLQEFGISLHHMKEFSHSAGDFLKWKNHQTDKLIDAERKRYFSSLLGHIIVRARRVFAQCVPTAEYREVNKLYKLEESVHPFTFCALSCAFRVHDWARKWGIPQDEVLLVFESGTHGFENFRSWMKKILSQEVIPMNKSHAPLQAADTISYEHLLGNRDISLEGATSWDDLRWSLDQLHDIPTDPADWGTIHAKSMEDFCERYGIPRR